MIVAWGGLLYQQAAPCHTILALLETAGKLMAL